MDTLIHPLRAAALALAACAVAPGLRAQELTLTHLAGPLGGAGDVDGPGAAARFDTPVGLAVDAAGNLFVGDHDRLRRISPAGDVTTLAGLSGTTGCSPGPGSAARFTGPSGL